MTPPNSKPRIVKHEFPDAGSAAAALAGAVEQSLRGAIEARGSASLVVSGGKSPVPFLEELGTRALQWSQVWVTLADERWVEVASSDSNEALVRRHLLRGRAEAARWVSLKSDAAHPIDGLPDVQARLHAMPRPFDAVVLGMGEDGHTASLFPGAPGLNTAMNPDAAMMLAAIDPPSAPHPRVTMTLATLLASRRLFVLIGGGMKREVIERAGRGADPLTLPIAAILAQRRVQVDVYWSEGAS